VTAKTKLHHPANKINMLQTQWQDHSNLAQKPTYTKIQV